MSKGVVALCLLSFSAHLACGSDAPGAARTNGEAGAAADGGLGGSGIGGMSQRDAAGAAGAGASGASDAGAGSALSLPTRAEIMTTLTRVNDTWMNAHPNPGDDQWARAVYFIGDSAFAEISGRSADLAYAQKWAQSHDYGLNGGSSTTNADNQCAGQTYLALSLHDSDPSELTALQTSLSAMTKAQTNSAWTWIDALFMAMPTFVQLGAYEHDASYFEEAFRLYDFTKRTVGGGLYNADDSLWYRDANYAPPAAEPNGQHTYWSRGNGWVFAAHARVLDALPESDPHRDEYLATFQAMAAALKAQQRDDGFWNVSLLDPTHFGGPETSGTALFVYGMALGIARGYLARESYEPAVASAYRGLVTIAVQADGSVGYVQGVGAAPASSQPVTPESTADFGVGALLLAGTAVYQLASE